MVKDSIQSALSPNMIAVTGGRFCFAQRVYLCGQLEYIECTLSDFAIGKYQVTFDEYDRYCEAMEIEKPSDPGWGRGKRPVIRVSWFDALAYCNWLSEQNGLAPAYKIEKEQVDRIADSKGFRLPTEAEWEFAARGGLLSKGYEYAGSNKLDEVGWYNNTNSDYKTHPVGEKKANELGLYDMSGNVCEWCWDWYGCYEDWGESLIKPLVNPQGVESGRDRIARGGSWHSYDGVCSSTSRGSDRPDCRSSLIGFRLAQDK